MLSPIFRGVSRCPARLAAVAPSCAAPGCCPWARAYHSGRCSASPMCRCQVRQSSSRDAPFYENPEYRSVKISPDGRHLSDLAPFDGGRNLCVAPIDGPNDPKSLTHATDRDIGWEYRWAFTNETSSSSATMAATRTGAPPASTPRTARSSRCRRTAASNRSSRNRKASSPRKCWRATTGATSIYSTCSGSMSSPARANSSLLTDSHFRLRLSDDGSLAWFERQEDDSWTPLMEGAAAATPTPQPARRFAPPLAAQSAGARDQAHLDRPGHDGCSRCAGRVGADGGGADPAGRAGDLPHLCR